MLGGPSGPTVVEVVTMLRLVASMAGVGPPVPARLSYNPRDPYAVQMHFLAAETVTWTFARDLLATGLDAPAGVGDVQIWPSPWTSPGGDVVAIALSSPDGRAVLEAPRRVLARFLRRTYVMVPRGQEPAHHDIDATLARLLE
jgi:hypothetical protein